MLNSVYIDVYDTKYISRYYIFNLLLYRILRLLYIIIDVDKISGIKRFINNNKNVSLYNNNNLINYIDYTGYKCNDNLDELYIDSITIACEYIEKINEYLTNV